MAASKISPLKGTASLEKRNMTELREKLAGKVEWQMLTLDFAEAVAAANAAATTSLAKPADDGADDEEEDGEEED